MKNVSRLLSQSFLSVLIFTVALSPTTGFSAASCGDICNNTTSAISSLIQDPKCKADPSCVQCVGNRLGDGQMASYCSAYSSSAKSGNSQDLLTDAYAATALVCGTACALQSSAVATAAGTVLAKVCGGLSLATTAADLVMSITSNNITGAAMGAVGAVGTAAKNIKMLSAGVNHALEGPGLFLRNLTKVPACGNFVMYGILSGIKIFSGKAIKNTKSSQCDLINNLGRNTSSMVQSCQAGPSILPTNGAGMFAATSESFATPTLEKALTQLGSTAADQFIKDMKGDLQKAEDLGKLNFGDIARRVDAGESASSILGSTGAPPALLAAIEDATARIQKGEKFAALDKLGGGYSAPSANLATTGSGTSEMGFGNAGVTSGGAAGSLEIDRKPAAAASALVNDGDILHSAFSGSIFDIVSLRIKEQKSQYADAEPEGRMNRVFNGYSDKNRKPASSTTKSTR